MLLLQLLVLFGWLSFLLSVVGDEEKPQGKQRFCGFLVSENGEAIIHSFIERLKERYIVISQDLRSRGWLNNNPIEARNWGNDPLGELESKWFIAK